MAITKFKKDILRGGPAEVIHIVSQALEAGEQIFLTNVTSTAGLKNQKAISIYSKNSGDGTPKMYLNYYANASEGSLILSVEMVSGETYDIIGMFYSVTLKETTSATVVVLSLIHI